MAQHKKLTLREMSDWLERNPNQSQLSDLLYTLVAVDQTLVKHDKTPLARQLRRSVHTALGHTNGHA